MHPYNKVLTESIFHQWRHTGDVYSVSLLIIEQTARPTFQNVTKPERMYLETNTCYYYNKVGLLLLWGSENNNGKNGTGL